MTLLWTGGDSKLPVDYRVGREADDKTKHDHFWELLPTTKARRFSPEYVLCHTWYARLENLKQVRDFVFTQEISAFEFRLRRVCDAIRSDRERPTITLPVRPTA
jgi:hypothetical protein